VTETPEQRVARLEAELAQAKVDALQKELAAARSESPAPATADATAFGADAELRRRAQAAVDALTAEGLHAELRTGATGGFLPRASGRARKSFGG
jgi:hypothetical protein